MRNSKSHLLTISVLLVCLNGCADALEPNCPPRQHLVGGECVPVNTALDCPAETPVPCNGVCIDPKTSDLYCGANADCTNFIACGPNAYCHDGICTAKPCPEGQHTAESGCEPDTLKHCGETAANCTALNGWHSGSCVNGNCIADSCQEKFDLQNGQCVEIPVTHEITDCGETHFDCTTLEGWFAGTCEDGQCILSQCQSGSHLYENTCEADSLENCGKHEHNCTVLPGWKDGTCQNGTCQITECQPGSHLHANACEEDSTANCGAHASLCTEIDGWKDGICQNGQCIIQACLPGFHLFNNTCEANTLENCGEHQRNCNTLEGVKDATCETATGTCVVNACIENRHIKDNACVLDTQECCGQSCLPCSEQQFCNTGECQCRHAYTWCSNACVDTTTNTNHCGGCNQICDIANAVDIECQNSQCVVKECRDHYHLFNNTCEKDTVEHCGDHNIDCSSDIEAWADGQCIDKTCIVSECQPGFHIDGNKCIKDTHQCCGSTCTPCSKDKYCSNGICKDTCELPLSYCNGTCVNYTSDNNNCGSCGAVCTTTSIDNSNAVNCSGGQCRVTECIEGYHKYHNICEIDDVDNCGSHNKSCESIVTGWESGECLDGICQLWKCLDGYHLKNNTCLEDSAEICGQTETNCLDAEGVDDAQCNEGKCEATHCKPGYHLYNKTCELDTDSHCGNHGAGCAANEICSGAICVCKPGYTQCDDTCIDTSITMNHCGTCDAVCSTEAVLMSTAVSCVESQCIATSCDSSSHLYDNRCESDTIEHCGDHNTNCTTSLTNATNVKCENKECKATSCNTSVSYLYNDKCELNSPQHCGNHDTKCDSNTVPNSSKQSCVNGHCIAIECQNTYHLYNNQCEYNDNAHCGSHNNACPTGSNCDATSGQCLCEPNYHPTASGCEADTELNCGGAGLACNATTVPNSLSSQCVDGVCIALTCNDDSYLFNNACEPNTIENCGAHGKRCNEQIPYGNGLACVSGNCTATSCDAGYYLHNGQCFANDNENCGGHNKACSTDYVCHTTTGTCQCADSHKTSCAEGSTTRCVDTTSDPLHCGTCGHTCDEGITCNNGTCEISKTICNGIEVNPDNDSANCGGCGNVCESGFECVNSTCKRITSLTESTTITCNAQTVKPYTDKQNCSGCGIACNTGYVCKQGSCQKSVVGNIIVFGHYEQDNNTTNGKEPIEWRVLDQNAEGQYLVISDKVLEMQDYNETYTSITWADSTIRSWLNGYAASYNSDGKDYNTAAAFINLAFTAEEQAKIVASNVPAHANPDYSTSPGTETTDKIFLLSIVEAQQYFANDTARLADATRYAVKQGVWVRGTDTVSTSGGTASYEGTCSNVYCYADWWLRSPGYERYRAAIVSDSGAVGIKGVDSGNYVFVGVRPALWLEDFANDNENCGDHTCDEGYTCNNGTCEISKTICNGIEVNLDNDSTNCGSCGNVCESGVCQNGGCTSSISPTYCNGVYTDIQTDIDNCGTCGNACAYGLDCINGRCLGNTNCSGIASNTKTDLDHCGACNHRCNDGLTCVDGECIVAPGSAYCGSQKVQLNTVRHCASCAACADGLICQNNQCVEGQGQMICNNVIIDSRSDSANCGGCGNVCQAGFECVNSTCKRITNMTSSTKITCNAQTVKPYTDEQNCSGCGIACNTRYACKQGSCQKATVGDIITFGHYEQDNNTTNGKEPIEWRVLDVSAEGQLLVISDKVLEKKEYNKTSGYITWKESTIRSWLNGYAASYNSDGVNYTSNNFIDAAFTAEEQAKIIASKVPAHANPDYDTSPGNATTDKIFLLSINEVNQYFANDTARLADATRYAVKQGVSVRGTDTVSTSGGTSSYDGTCSNVYCYANWWLRSPGDHYYSNSVAHIDNYSNYAAYVDRSGAVNTKGHYLSHAYYGVRPALWLN